MYICIIIVRSRKHGTNRYKIEPLCFQRHLFVKVFKIFFRSYKIQICDLIGSNFLTANGLQIRILKPVETSLKAPKANPASSHAKI